MAVAGGAVTVTGVGVLAGSSARRWLNESRGVSDRIKGYGRGDGPNTYTGIGVKSGKTIDDYNRPGSAQRQFDEAVDGGHPRAGNWTGKKSSSLERKQR